MNTQSSIPLAQLVERTDDLQKRLEIETNRMDGMLKYIFKLAGDVDRIIARRKAKELE